MANDENLRPLRSISAFKSKLLDGGARANLFEVQLDNVPDGILVEDGWNTDLAESFSFLCKASALPASNLSSIDVPFRGRSLKVAGDRTIDPWTITIINDGNMAIRQVMEAWMEGITRLDNAAGTSNPMAYMGQATVFQLGRSGELNNESITEQSNHVVLGRYRFLDIFPTNVSQIDVSYDSTDTIEEFTVEFSVNNMINLANSGTTEETTA